MNNSLLYELSDEIIRNKSNRIKFKARGSSMRPFVKDGDIVEIEPIDEFDDVNKGDILLFSRGSSVCLHRVVGLSGGSFTIKGDSSRYIDGNIDADNIIGRLIKVERNGNQFKININWLNKIAPFSWIWYRFIFICKKLLKPILRPIHDLILSISYIRRVRRNLYRNKISILVAKVEDAYDICTFYQQYSLEEKQNVKKIIADNESYYIIAKLRNNVLGVACLGFDDGKGLWNGWWLTGLQVKARFRGIGVGQEIVNLAINKVNKMGGSSLKLLAFEGRKPAGSLYEKIGFERVIDPEIEQLLEDEVKKGIPRRIYMVKNIL